MLWLNNFRLSRIILDLGEDSSSDDGSESDSDLDGGVDEFFQEPSFTSEPVDAEYVTFVCVLKIKVELSLTYGYEGDC